MMKPPLVPCQLGTSPADALPVKRRLRRELTGAAMNGPVAQDGRMNLASHMWYCAAVTGVQLGIGKSA
jgi:hypothetical protein